MTTQGGDAAVGIHGHAAREIAAHAHEAWPHECCGLLIGTPSVVESVHRARNMCQSPARYLVRPEDHFDAIRAARARGLDVIGAYHSHPAGRPCPSETDLVEAHDGGFLYVIAGASRLRRTAGARAVSAPPRVRAGAQASSVRRRRGTASMESNGFWLAAWRLVGGNFVQVPLVAQR